MFTGIIENLGIVKKNTASKLCIMADAALIGELVLGSSIAVNGACLTVSEMPDKKTFTANLMQETLGKTMLGSLFPNSAVNLELPMTADGRFDGHMVQGHVDGTATIKTIRQMQNSYIFSFTASKHLLKYMVEKGSVAVNGISLTLIDIAKDGFVVGIIPYTWRNTMLQYAKPGDKVNIEADILAKHVYAFTKQLFAQYNDKH